MLSFASARQFDLAKELLSIVPCSSLTVVGSDEEYIDDEEAKYLSELLLNNTTLTELNLEGINRDGITFN